MSPVLVFAVFAVLVLSLTVFRLFFYRTWKRRRVLARPLPDTWRELMKTQIPLYRRLPSALQQQLENHVRLFLAEKDFYGCDGFEVDDRVRVTIAGHACLLVVARNFSDFDHVTSVLVYPSAFHVREEYNDGPVVSVQHEIRAGEASDFGRVVLSWTDCEKSLAHPEQDFNVILHEFAHQLDFLDGSADGAPPLSGEEARQWQHTMSEAYAQLQASLGMTANFHAGSKAAKPWLDPYGATEPAEFFAVLTEAFFQQPEHLRQVQPKVYKALSGFYRLDPTTFREA
ncbi:M90 family metallopeptidase [uncultured Marinobacter sp.]|uniref:M90 family metallopeptidase n=1 Tax=uncultured Marinobacter sp. TaxID=187379 RepID=UPI0030D70DAB